MLDHQCRRVVMCTHFLGLGLRLATCRYLLFARLSDSNANANGHLPSIHSALELLNIRQHILIPLLEDMSLEDTGGRSHRYLGTATGPPIRQRRCSNVNK